MELLYPLGMLAAASISVPLLIHLWNTQKRKLLKVGSIGLMALTTKRSSKQIRINNWLLLVLRCLLLLLLAFILALPYLHEKRGKDQTPGWLLIEKRDLNTAYQQSKSTIDSLIKLGYELRDFSKDFKEISLADTAASAEVPAGSIQTNLLAALNEVVPAKHQIYLFSDRRLSKLPPNLPALQFDLHWKEIERADTLSNWVSNYKSKEFSGRSTPTASWYTNAKVKPDTTGIVALIQSDPGAPDASYLRAALQTIIDYSGRKMTVENWSAGRQQALKPDLVFWLSTKPIPEMLLNKWKEGATLFSYALGKPESIVSGIYVNEEGTIKLPEEVLRLRIPNKSQEQGLWTDSYGQPLLTLTELKGLQRYILYTRFNPSWTELVWNEQFVKMMMPLILQSNLSEFGYEQHADDQRLVSAQPFRRATHTSASSAMPDRMEPLQFWFWIAALVVLVVERLLTMFSKGRNTL